MRIMMEVPRDLELYTEALEGLTLINERMYRRNKSMPSIFDRSAGVKYTREYPGEEDWKHVGRVLSDRTGDCEDLAAARAGELRARGDRRARALIRRTGPRMTHAYVRHGDGTIEDPSKRLGMGRP